MLEYNKIKFGRLNKGLCGQLYDLVAKDQIDIHAFMFTKDWHDALKGWENDASHHVLAEINIYGAKERAQEIGSALSKSGIFLQMPKHGLEDDDYYNPQLLRVEGFPDMLSPEPENGQLESELSLWKYNDVDSDEPFYQHVLSGAKRPQRVEARGGIIADEMGLGKSLVILSTIAGSLDRAEAFAMAESQQGPSQPRRKQASKATLIISPSSLLIDSWVDEIQHTYSGIFPFHKHIGSTRHQETHLLYDRSIVFTTYATAAAEFRRGQSILSETTWFRIVLDEAHDIRNRATNQFQAMSGIPALHRWCLTGTPIQNSLGALVSFLKVPILENAPTFRKLIVNPINSTSGPRFHNLQILLRAVCLRRTRQLLDLPEPISKTRIRSLTPSERADYQKLLSQCREEIDMAVSRPGRHTVSSACLKSLLKLRLFCNNGLANTTIQPGPTGLPDDPDEALIYLQQFEENLIVFSSWKKPLTRIHELLVHYGIPHRTIDGSLRLAERVNVLKDFRSPVGTDILLMTLGIGATEPDYCIAHIPSGATVESIHRVVIIRYIMKETIEENLILFRQKRKLELAGDSFNRGKDMQPERLQLLLDVFGMEKAGSRDN
ncbi:uncharacterized protein E0L32_001721 [Thyridium curvatum]|uniref:Helicase ATP-binding domain-containing protein n=1 Tax=Thyridium curvatum TaxID=1093900 RepID=A0A507AWG1_9PEZI|nr:uncharacterized protein E0L32_001478 [Thyridium curvatum]XP_030990972.1 uncharacterized protein E0L32_001721 [Thyridium curvatum]TPX09018.1 hypothetical protein E0L32_001478 [Thyridium curvatum]TPX09261.1 hypothetical protein E0L32_001721 [Thyridium curvatum]